MRRAEAGFTLIEMLVALAIMAAAVLIAMPLTRAGGAAQAVRLSASDIAATARMVRAAALRGGVEYALMIDGDVGTFWSEGVTPARGLPRGVSVDLSVPPGERLRGGLVRIRFLPDGGSSGGKITLRDGGRQAEVSVDWLTGGAHVAAR